MLLEDDENGKDDEDNKDNKNDKNGEGDEDEGMNRIEEINEGELNREERNAEGKVLDTDSSYGLCTCHTSIVMPRACSS